MATNYPTSLDSFTRPAGTQTLADANHSAIEDNQYDAIEALEAKVGVGAGTPTANTLLVGSGNGTATWGGTVNSLVLGTPAITGGTISSLTTAQVGTLTSAVANTPIRLDALYTTPQTYSPSASGTATLDLSLGNDHKITMPAGNITVALSNATTGQKFKVDVTQDATGSRTVTWFSTIKWAGGNAPTLTPTANKRDTFGFEVTGSGTYDGYVIGQNI